MTRAHAGVLFMHNEGYSTMCGHGIVAVCTIALERGLIGVPGEPPVIALESPAGLVRARATRAAPTRDDAAPSRVSAVAFENVPSFVYRAGLPVAANDRTVAVDVAFGGAFYAIVDSEAVGIPLRRESLAALRRTGMDIARAVERVLRIVHPLDPGLEGVYGTIFTGMAEAGGADLRNATIFADRQVDRSPCGTGTAAVMAVLDAMGLLDEERAFAHREPRRHVVPRAPAAPHGGRRVRGHRPGDRGFGLDHRRAHLSDRRRRPPPARIPAVATA